jgi:hypothetical protein
MTAPEPTQPLTDEELFVIRGAVERAELFDEETLPLAFSDRKKLLAEVSRLRAENTAQAEALAAGEASDGYHTHNELYDYRMLYNAHAAHGWLAAGHLVVKSWTHSDGELCFGGGWFVVAAELPTGQVTNHYEAKHWSLFKVPEAVPPEYDGHSPAEAADRLRAALDQSGEGQTNG